MQQPPTGYGQYPQWNGQLQQPLPPSEQWAQQPYTPYPPADKNLFLSNPFHNQDNFNNQLHLTHNGLSNPLGKLHHHLKHRKRKANCSRLS